MKKFIFIFLILILTFSSCTKIIEDKIDENESQIETIEEIEIDDELNIIEVDEDEIQTEIIDDEEVETEDEQLPEELSDNSMDLIPTREPLIKNDEYYAKLLNEYLKLEKEIWDLKTFEEKLLKYSLKYFVVFNDYFDSIYEFNEKKYLLTVFLSFFNKTLDELYENGPNNHGLIFVKEELFDMYALLYDRKIDYSKIDNSHDLYYSPEQQGIWISGGGGGTGEKFDYEIFDNGNGYYDLKLHHFSDYSDWTLTQLYKYKLQDNRLILLSIVLLDDIENIEDIS